MNWLLKLFAPTVPRKTRLVRAVLLFLLVLASGYRVWLVVAYNPMDWLYSDPARHWYAGIHPLDTAPMAAIDPVLYGTYLTALAKFTVGSPILVAYWTALLSLSCPWLWYRFLRELLPSRDYALAGWVIFSALPSWSVIYCYLMQETLMLPLLGAALWATWRCKRKRDLASFLLATGAWMLAGLTRGICIPMAAVAMTYLWILQGDKLRKSVFAVALLMSVLGPLAGRSWYLARVISPHGMGNMASLYYRAGTVYMSFYFSRSGGTETWNYTFRSPAHYPFEPFSYWTGVRPGHVYFSIDLDHGMRDWDAERRNLPEWTVQRYQWVMSYNLIHLFIDHSWPELEHYDRAGKPGGALDALALGSFGRLLPGGNIAVLATPARPPAAGFAVDLVPRADARCVQRGPLSETGRGPAYRANVGPGGGSFIPAPVETRRSGRSSGARASRDNASPMRPSGQSEPT